MIHCPHCGSELSEATKRAAMHEICARGTAARRVTVPGPGRHPIPTLCPKCGAGCASAVEARRHCQKRRVPKA